MHYCCYYLHFRVFSAVVFTALTMGRASSFAPDAQKAQLSAARIFNLANREPEIDNYDTDGEKMVKMVKFNPKNSNRIYIEALFSFTH